MTTLNTLPNFLFMMGDVGGENSFEPLIVKYYKDAIQLEQEDQCIAIPYDCLTELMDEIERHKQEAFMVLSRK